MSMHFRYKRFPQECKTTSTTDIKPKTFHSLYHEQDHIGCKSCSDVRARQERRNTRTRPWKETNIPDTMSSNEETNESSGKSMLIIAHVILWKLIITPVFRCLS